MWTITGNLQKKLHLRKSNNCKTSFEIIFSLTQIQHCVEQLPKRLWHSQGKRKAWRTSTEMFTCLIKGQQRW